MEDWKKRLGELSFTKGYYFKLGDNGLIEKKDDQLVFNREELESFIQQELDRAREEGRREGLEDILSEVENWKTHYLDTTKSEPSKTMQIGLVNVIRKMLSKLTTK